MTTAVTAAVSTRGLEIPLIDFVAFLDPSTSATTRLASAQAILAGFQHAGFIYLRNHGIPQADIDRTFTEAARFFAQPAPEKHALAWTTPAANRGYSRPGLEKTTDLTDVAAIAAQRATEGADLKESFEIGRDDDPAFPNRWPSTDDADADAGFRAHMQRFFAQGATLHAQLLSALALALRLPNADWFARFCDARDNTLRLLHYPRDAAGGLQVQAPGTAGEFVDAPPVPGTVVVNAGDLLARWSNDVVRSTKHRVVQPPQPPAGDGEAGEWCAARYSIAYFCNPNADAWIDAIPGTFEDGIEGRGKKYPAVRSGEYLVQRLTATY
nr:upf0676 protein [Quercus suber]